MKIELEPFRIGPIEINFPVVLAPLAGYSDLPFRALCRRFGAVYCTTEMMLDRSVTARRRKRLQLSATDENDHPIAGQLIGNDPDQMVPAAIKLQGEGFDVIDLNFACPVHKALRRRRGGHLMRDPKLAAEIVRAVIGAVDVPVTLKVRKTFDNDGTEEEFDIISAGAVEAGAAAITVHGRSVEQKYTGVADWDFLRRVKSNFPDWTVIGSGDVHTAQDALDMFDRTGVDGVAVARGAIGNPWFFRQVRDLAAGKEPYRPSLQEQRLILEEHFEGALALYGARRAPAIMRKVGIKYARMHDHPKEVRMAFVAIKKPEHWYSVLDAHYGPPMA